MVLTLCKHCANTVTTMVFHDKFIKIVDKNFFHTIFETVTEFLFVLCMYACMPLSLSLYFAGHVMSPHPSDQLSKRTHVSLTALQWSEDGEIKHCQRHNGPQG